MEKQNDSPTTRLANLNLDSFIPELIAIGFFPLAPIFIELVIQGEVHPLTACLSACMYPITVASWAKSPAILWTSLFVTIVCVASYGSIMSSLQGIDAANLFNGGNSEEIKHIRRITIISYCVIIFTFLTFLIRGITSHLKKEKL